MTTNIADGNDYVPVQAGRVLGKSRAEILADREAAKAASLARLEKRGTGGGVQNVRIGNARVGTQADEIHGVVTVTW